MSALCRRSITHDDSNVSQAPGCTPPTWRFPPRKSGSKIDLSQGGVALVDREFDHGHFLKGLLERINPSAWKACSPMSYASIRQGGEAHQRRAVSRYCISVFSCIKNGLSQPSWIGKAQLMTAANLDQPKQSKLL
jgi:hypothetical protein